MALEKVVYEDKKTVISAKNLNDIQDAVIDLEEKIAESNEIFSRKMERGAEEYTDFPELIVGKVYTVRWDGADYACMCRDSGDGDTTYLGSLSGIVDERIEPFYIGYSHKYTTLIGAADGEPGHTVTIYDGYPSYYRYMILNLGTPVIEGELAFTSNFCNTDLDFRALEVGKIYRVKWGAWFYDCVLKQKTVTDGTVDTVYMLGNDSLSANEMASGTGEPFYFHGWYTGTNAEQIVLRRLYKHTKAAETIPYGIYEKP